MFQATCIQKFKKNNKIYGYRLQDSQGNIKDVLSDQLKQAIKSGQITITNLVLTSDNRLIESKAESKAESKEKNIVYKPLYKVCSDVADFAKVLINRKDTYSTAMNTFENDDLTKLGVRIVFFFDPPEASGEAQYRISIELRGFAGESLDSEQLYGSDATDVNKIYKSAEYFYYEALTCVEN